MEKLSVRVYVPDRLPAGSLVQVAVVITNVANEPILVNQRLLVNHEISDGEIFFRIENSAGNEFPFQALVTPRDLDDEDFRVLAVGEAITKTVNLADRFGIKKPGKYKIVVSYRNTYSSSKAGLEAWTGTVSSAPVVIEIQ